MFSYWRKVFYITVNKYIINASAEEIVYFLVILST